MDGQIKFFNIILMVMLAFNMLNMHTICHVDNFRWLDDGKDQNGMRFLE